MELVIFKHYKSVPVVVLAHSKWMTFESVIHIDSKAARLWIINPNIARITSCARLLLLIVAVWHLVRSSEGCCSGVYSPTIWKKHTCMQKAGDSWDISPQIFLDFPQNFRLRTRLVNWENLAFLSLTTKQTISGLQLNPEGYPSSILRRSISTIHILDGVKEDLQPCIF